MIRKLRAILDTEEDVFVDILIHPDQSLEDLHLALKKVLGKTDENPALFYFSNEEWMQGGEVVMPEFKDSEDDALMNEVSIDVAFDVVGKKMIYIYDFIDAWTFYCECVEISDFQAEDLPAVVMQYGEIPDAPPGNSLDFDDFDDLSNDGFEEDMDDDFAGEFEDEYDF
ncbi:MAG: hypothetical protein Q4F57_00140 [Weeksellaceae bacterium]|nr:hypothetical protein [Weeksellaceae bacterium]